MSNHLSETRTETLILDLLDIQSWPIAKPPKGDLVRQNEYKTFPELGEIFKGGSKTGKGDAYPDFLIINGDSKRPQIVIEAKADEKDIDKALSEACHYGEICMKAGHPVICIGVAGQEKTGMIVTCSKFHQGKWRPIMNNGKNISWIPTPSDTAKLLSDQSLMDLAPVVPRPEVLAEKADLINRILREANVKDEFRPAYVGAMMLALWQSKGSLRRDVEYVLSDVNNACETAFSKGGKQELAKSLHVDEANTKLAASTWRILATLEKLNVVTASFDHDYLGQLYETFFRFTGGNTIGQYFTPRHIAKFMADICETTSNDVILDPCCGSGGFLIAHLQRVLEKSDMKYEDAVHVISKKIVGYESEPVTAALCVANMILRGDGKTGIRKADCFSAKDYPFNRADVVLMNPPFPHEKTDIPSQKFVERALEGLKVRGKLAVILPTSLMVKKGLGKWRENILSKNTLLAVCQLPDELFQPYASATTSIVLIEKGVPHDSKKKTVFARLQYDGLTLKKGTRVLRQDGKNQIDAAVDAIINKKEEAGFSGLEHVAGNAEWSSGAYIPAAIPTTDELKCSIDELLRRLASFYVRYASEVANLRTKIDAKELNASPYRTMVGEARISNAKSLPSEIGTIGKLFDIFYGQKELHSRDGIPTGDSLVVSPTESYNGCYGWLTFAHLIEAPFVTVAQTGSIGEAFVQLESCGVNDDCLVLLPKENTKLPISCFLIAAAIIRLEKWRFSYGRKLTPSRICDFAMKRMPDLEKWVEDKMRDWKKITEAAVKNYTA